MGLPVFGVKLSARRFSVHVDRHRRRNLLVRLVAIAADIYGCIEIGIPTKYQIRNCISPHRLETSDYHQSRGGSCHRPPTGDPLCSTRLGRSGLAPCVSSELWRNGSRQVQLRGAGHPLVSTRHGVHGGRGACQWCWRRSWLRPSAAVQQGTTHPCERPMWPVFARW